jgi:hypothetical protein
MPQAGWLGSITRFYKESRRLHQMNKPRTIDGSRPQSQLVPWWNYESEAAATVFGLARFSFDPF